MEELDFGSWLCFCVRDLGTKRILHMVAYPMYLGFLRLHSSDYICAVEDAPPTVLIDFLSASPCFEVLGQYD